VFVEIGLHVAKFGVDLGKGKLKSHKWGNLTTKKRTPKI
jgi:hypothetical protein